MTGFSQLLNIYESVFRRRGTTKATSYDLVYPSPEYDFATVCQLTEETIANYLPGGGCEAPERLVTNVKSFCEGNDTNLTYDGKPVTLSFGYGLDNKNNDSCSNTYLMKSFLAVGHGDTYIAKYSLVMNIDHQSGSDAHIQIGQNEFDGLKGESRVDYLTTGYSPAKMTDLTPVAPSDDETVVDKEIMPAPVDGETSTDAVDPTDDITGEETTSAPVDGESTVEETTTDVVTSTDDQVVPEGYGHAFSNADYNFATVCQLTEDEVAASLPNGGCGSPKDLVKAIKSFCEETDFTYEGSPVTLAFGHVFDNGVVDSCSNTYLLTVLPDTDDVAYSLKKFSLVMNIDRQPSDDDTSEIGETEYAELKGDSTVDYLPFAYSPLELTDLTPVAPVDETSTADVIAPTDGESTVEETTTDVVDSTDDITGEESTSAPVDGESTVEETTAEVVPPTPPVDVKTTTTTTTTVSTSESTEEPEVSGASPASVFGIIIGLLVSVF